MIRFWTIPVLALIAFFPLAAPQSAVAGATSHVPWVFLAAGSLTGNVGRNLKEMDNYLNDAEKFINETPRSEAMYRRAKDNFEEAENYYRKITDYEMGKFDESHPDWVTGSKRLEDARVALDSYHREVVLGESPAQVVGEASQQSVPTASTVATTESAREMAKAATPEPASETAKAAPSGPLNSMVAYGLKSVVEFLEAAEKVMDPALQVDSGPAGRLAQATPLLEDAEWKLNSIRKDYAGKFSESDPEFTAVVDRLAADKAMLKAFSGDNSGALLAKATYEGMSYEERNAVDRMREVARRRLADYEKDYDFLTKALEGKVAADNPILVEMNEIITTQRQWVAEAPARAAAQKAEGDAAMNAEYSAIIADVQAQYEDWGPVNALHAQHVGQIVFSRETTKKVVDDDDEGLLDDRFSLVDPLYATAFLARSLGNTAVWSTQTGKPRDNFDFSYTFRLFIDDQEIGANEFTSEALDEADGQVVTVLPFTPNPVPIETGFLNEAEDWRRATAHLEVGEYQIRAELWAGQHVQYSREPIAAGSFTLVKSEGERIAARGTFPRDNYSGDDDINQLKAQVAKELMKEGVSLDSVLDISLTDDWVIGTDAVTKQQWRQMSTATLYADDDGDGVCKYGTRNYRSNLAGDSWSVLRYFSIGNFGEVECPK